jgi:TolB-like protein
MAPLIPSRLPNLEQWSRIEEVFHRAREASGEAREALLNQLCAGDHLLLGDVRALLAADTEVNRMPQPRERWKPDLAGRRAGNYQLDSLIGAGGMGSVYLAHRCDGQFDRQVAFKFLSTHLRNEVFTSRFAAERTLLASLDHPNITRLIDSGVSDSGDPYLVLEYVDGDPIDAHCDRLRLTVGQRIASFLEVCEAVVYAHSAGVIHRDLKPANILVSRDGQVKLLDFGTAKLLEDPSAAVTTTRFQMLTPRYASPEQLRGDPVTSATDLYSLGIVLYELVTGAWPFGNPASVISGFERAIREVSPQAPRTVIEPPAAERRGTTKEALIRECSGPLWDVIRKSIACEPGKRYATVAEFAQDLRSYLAGRKVQARPQRRARAGTLTLAAVTAVLAATAGGAWWTRHKPPAPPSVAVLPFTGVGYLASGLTAEISESLVRHALLKVIAQPSARQVAADYKDKPVDFRDAGKRLHVTAILTGDVEQAGDSLKIVATLVRTSDGAPIWTNTYQRLATALSVIESDMDQAVAYSLGVAQAPPRKHVPNEEAHALYLKARFVANQGAAGIAQAEQYCRRAVELDPQYGDAWTCLSSQLWNKNTVNPDPAAIKTGLEYTLRALDLDPSDVRAHYQLGLNAMYFDWDWKRAQRELKVAAAGRFGGADISLALLYLITGNRAEVDEHLRRAKDLDPTSPASLINIAELLALEGRYAEASEQYRTVAARVPTVPRWQILIARCDGLRGRKDAAVTRLNAFPKPGREVQRELAYWSGDWNRARRVTDEEAQEYESTSPSGAQTGLSMTSLAESYGALGDEANAVKWLDRAIASHEGDVVYIRVAWQFARFQDTPQFHRLKQRVNLDW